MTRDEHKTQAPTGARSEPKASEAVVDPGSARIRTHNFDPFDPTTRENPYPVYARLRREAPVYRSETLGCYVLSRHRDVLFALKHPELFSSAAMNDLIGRVDGLVREVDPDAGPPEDAEMLIGIDPPRHIRLRKLANRGFTPRRVAALEPRIREIARELVDAFAERGECDFVGELAQPLPTTVIAELLGIEPSRRDEFRRWSDALILASSGAPADHEKAALVGTLEPFFDHLDELVEERRRRPGDDLVSALVRVEDGEELMTAEEVKFLTILLLVAGNETTTNLLGNTLLALFEHPGELWRLENDPSRAPALIEEVLRYDAPVQLVLRRTTQALEIAGHEIPDAATVVLLLGSANRDEVQFPNPDLLDAARDTRGHLGFGFGTHYCLGAALARLEARLALEAFFSRSVRVEGVRGSVERVPSMLVRGPRQLPVTFETRSPASRPASAA
jgi:cytochrome P450